MPEEKQPGSGLLFLIRQMGLNYERMNELVELESGKGKTPKSTTTLLVPFRTNRERGSK